MDEQLSKIKASLVCPYCQFEEPYNLLNPHDYCSIVDIVHDFNRLYRIRCTSCLARFVCSENLVLTKG